MEDTEFCAKYMSAWFSMLNKYSETKCFKEVSHCLGRKGTNIFLFAVRRGLRSCSKQLIAVF